MRDLCDPTSSLHAWLPQPERGTGDQTERRRLGPASLGPEAGYKIMKGLSLAGRDVNHGKSDSNRGIPNFFGNALPTGDADEFDIMRTSKPNPVKV
jgi:hypothetical protein